ncbi:MAG TPA: NAD+ synthase [Solirubrobacterales bacterium]|nr:NAD+ synthase [Solirubrobacterales bacterium]
MRVALAQIDPTVGDIDGNLAKITAWIGRAREAGAELAIFPELCIPGYPAEDLYLKPHFLAANVRAVERLAAGLEPGITVLVGFAEPAAGGGDHRHAHNSLAVLADRAVQAVYRKNRLPNYAVFDEQRYFIPGTEGDTVDIGDTGVGLTICEDTWTPGPPGQAEADAGAALIANPSGSPYHRGKGHEREEMFGERAREYGSYIAFVNLVGGQDELVFDGQSLLFGPDGAVLARAAQFEEELLIAEVPPTPSTPAPLAEPLADLDEVYAALVLGLRDYVEKNGFGHVGLGISGGIDSALVAMLAVDALGPERVTLVVMPSPHSSAETQADARQIADNLGTGLIEIGIEPMMEGYRAALDRHLRPAGEDVDASPTDPTKPSEPDLAAENIQARIRGNLMMALSNRHGWLVLTTGNKSEMSVGYATLYGDMAGGFAVIKDVPKTLVYRLVERRNERAGRDLVPAAVIERPPSAELRPDQLDSDSLPDYDLLDRILEAYVERDEGRDEMVAAGLGPGEVVDEVIRLVDRAEYKRRQAAPGIRITPKAFGRDRRLPMTNRFGG